MGCLNASSSAAGQAPPPAETCSPRTVASTEAACSPPITEIRAFGHMNRKRGEYARPHMA
jgi:hypothetical protein